MFNLTVSEAHTFYVGTNGWLVHNVGAPRATDVLQLNSRVGESPRMVRLAQGMSEQAQADVDRMIEQLRAGNRNPGIGTNALGDGYVEFRGRNGGRIIARATANGFDIFAKFQGHSLGEVQNNKLVRSIVKMAKNLPSPAALSTVCP